jgi:hypothetical protein
MPLEDISFTDISISISDIADSGYPEMADDIPSMSQAGFFIRNAHHLRLENVEVTGQVGEAFDCRFGRVDHQVDNLLCWAEYNISNLQTDKKS